MLVYTGYNSCVVDCLDLVWSDPEDVETWAVSPRGAGWLFGAKVTYEVTHILQSNDVSLFVSAH